MPLHLVPALLSLLVPALLACSPPATSPATPQSPTVEAPTQPPAPGEVPPPLPAHYLPPAAQRQHLSGQSAHLGVGRHCAFYAIGWSHDGAFAYATDTRSDDMGREYTARWQVLDPSGAPAGSLDYQVAEWSDEAQARFAGAWQARQGQIDDLLHQHGIQPDSATDPLPLPQELGGGTVDARWELAPLDALLQRATLTMSGPVPGQQRVLYDQPISRLQVLPPQAHLIRHRDAHHAALLAEVVEGDPVEGMVTLRYLVYAL